MKVAKRPTPRTVHVVIADGAYAGWEATALADFPAKWLGDLQSNDPDRSLAALDRLIVEHNMPGPDGKLAASVGDVDAGGLQAISEAIGAELRSLPPR